MKRSASYLGLAVACFFAGGSTMFASPQRMSPKFQQEPVPATPIPSPASLSFPATSPNTNSTPLHIALTQINGYGVIQPYSIGPSDSAFIVGDPQEFKVQWFENTASVTFTPQSVGLKQATLRMNFLLLGSVLVKVDVPLLGTAAGGRPLTTASETAALPVSSFQSAQTLQVQGANFAGDCSVSLNGQALTTSWVSGSLLKATIPAGVVSPGTSALTVTSASRGTSNPVFLPIRQSESPATFGNAAGSPFASMSASNGALQYTVADFNGDGKPDFAVTGGVFTLIYLSNGDGTFRVDSSIAQYTGSVWSAANPYGAGSSIVPFVPLTTIAGDFNGDGILDVAVLSTQNFLHIFRGAGGGSFVPMEFDPATGFPKAYGNGITSSAMSFRSGLTADFNHDGKLDLAIASAHDNGVWIVPGNGDGSFGSPTYVSTGANPVAIAAADFNNDDHIDLAVASQGSNSVQILAGDGLGGFSLFQTIYSLAPSALAVGDFNRDGYADLAIANSGGGNVTVYEGTGTKALSPVSVASAGSAPAALVVGDFDGDGFVDMAVANSDDGTVMILKGLGTGWFSVNALLKVGTSATVLGIADWNNDGKLDLVAADPTTGKVSVLMSK